MEKDNAATCVLVGLCIFAVLVALFIFAVLTREQQRERTPQEKAADILSELETRARELKIRWWEIRNKPNQVIEFRCTVKKQLGKSYEELDKLLERLEIEATQPSNS